MCLLWTILICVIPWCVTGALMGAGMFCFEGGYRIASWILWVLCCVSGSVSHSLTFSFKGIKKWMFLAAAAVIGAIVWGFLQLLVN